MKVDRNLRKKMKVAGNTLKGAWKAIVAGAAGAALLASNISESFENKTAKISSSIKKTQTNREVVEMKKSTLIALFVALATVAGVLGALYVYVLRREKELDEYEQLLFSEDFSEDFTDDFEDELAQEEAEPVKA